MFMYQCHLLARSAASEQLVVQLQRSFDESRQRSHTQAIEPAAGANSRADAAAAGWVDLSEQHAERASHILLVFAQVCV